MYNSVLLEEVDKFDKIGLDEKTAQAIKRNDCSSYKLKAAHQYIAQHFHLYYLGMNDIAEVFENIAINQLRHYNTLGMLLIKLGNKVDAMHSKKVSRNMFLENNDLKYEHSAHKIVLDALVLEIELIDFFKDVIVSINNLNVQEVIQDIIKDSENNILVLNRILERFLVA